MIEDMRKCYKSCEPFLSTTIRQVEQGDIVKEAKVEALKSIAKTMFGINLTEVKIEKEKELGKELSSDEEIELLENEIKKLREDRDPQVIIAEEELEKHLAEGWEFVSVLPSKKILIRKESWRFLFREGLLVRLEFRQERTQFFDKSLFSPVIFFVYQRYQLVRHLFVGFDYIADGVVQELVSQGA